MSRFINIESVQSTSHLGTNIDCEVIARHLTSLRFKFNPKFVHKIAVFIESPKVRITIFRSHGKLVLFGGKSIADSCDALQVLVQELLILGNQVNDVWLRKVQYYEPTVNNIVGSGYIGNKIDLWRFANHDEHSDYAIYECEQFPGLRYRNLLRNSSSVTATIFNSGKCIVTGGKNENDILDGYDRLIDISEPFTAPTLDPIIMTNIVHVDPMRRLPNGNELYMST